MTFRTGRRFTALAMIFCVTAAYACSSSNSNSPGPPTNGGDDGSAADSTQGSDTSMTGDSTMGDDGAMQGDGAQADGSDAAARDGSDSSSSQDTGQFVQDSAFLLDAPYDAPADTWIPLDDGATRHDSSQLEGSVPDGPNMLE